MAQVTEMITKQEAQDIAESAAERAVHKLFLSLDVNVTDLGEIRRFRDDLKYLQEQRRGSEDLKKAIKRGTLGIVLTVVIPSMIFTLWSIFKEGLPLWLGRQ